MPVRQAPPQPAPPPRETPYPAEKARGGEIILRKRWQRVVFFGALVAAILLAVFFRLFG
jgi:hypothetical protein